jgi:ribosome-binding protein aMBF1 (putative translation factor)
MKKAIDSQDNGGGGAPDEPTVTKGRRSGMANQGYSFEEGTPEINMRFGARLSDLRQKSGLSQEELAARLLVPVSHVEDVEGGRRSASIIDLESFAQQFKVSLSELLRGL